MNNISQEYIGAIVILIMSILKMFNIEIASEAVTGLITGIVAIWIAVRRYEKGDISPLGRKFHTW